MYRIGEFSNLTRFTVQTLRYYDEEGLLKPTRRDDKTGYRYYSDHDFKKASLIHLLFFKGNPNK